MDFIKRQFTKEGPLAMIVAVVFGVLVVTFSVQAATTISTNIDTNGTLNVSNATSSISNLSMINSTSTNATSTSFRVSNLASFFQASSSVLSANEVSFGGSATATISTAGVASFPSTLTILGLGTSLTNAGTASTSKLRIGGDSVPVIDTAAGTFGTTTLSGAVFGYCNLDASVTITATTSAYAVCSDATGLRAGDRVFVQATSSLPSGLMITAASTTGTAQISFLIANTIANALAGGSTATGLISINFWGWR